jgi:hypothetical protein
MHFFARKIEFFKWFYYMEKRLNSKYSILLQDLCMVFIMFSITIRNVCIFILAKHFLRLKLFVLKLFSRICRIFTERAPKMKATY